jgi:hypothetical protein
MLALAVNLEVRLPVREFVCRSERIVDYKHTRAGKPGRRLSTRAKRAEIFNYQPRLYDCALALRLVRPNGTVESPR